MKKEFLVGGLVSLLLVLAVSWFLVQEDARTLLSRQAHDLELVSQDLESRFFTRHRQELQWLASQKPVREFLSLGSSTSGNVPRILKFAEGLLDLEAVYLVSPGGQIVTASDPAYLGAQIGFRPYVKAGLAASASYAMSVGVVTKTRGLYAAVPVLSEGRVVGVAAFRTPATLLDSFLSGHPGLFLLDAEGQVFSASDPSQGNTARWTWEGEGRVRVQDRWYRVCRQPLVPVPGFSLVSLQPESWPWTSLLLADTLILLLIVTGFLVYHQVSLIRRHGAEDRQRRQREALLANLLEGIAVLDRSGTLVWANPAFDRLVQREAGDPPLRLEDLWDSPASGPWKEVLGGTRPWVVFESVLRGRHGAWTPVMAGFTLAGDQYLLSVLDRSERHRSDQLLRHSQKLTVLGQLSGGVAHDLNNMLGVLMGMTDLLRMTLPEQDPLQESVELMLTTLTRAASLADKMLNFARQTPMVREPLDVAALLRELRFLARTALPESIQAVVEGPDQPVWVEGDENLLLSALLNLILNAGEAMPRGGTVLVRGACTGDDQFEILVEDEGKGMDPETLGRIFEPFFSTKHDEKGTGLGLSLVRRTILEHRGSIDIQSEPGVGTKVRVLLPLRNSRPLALPEAAALTR